MTRLTFVSLKDFHKSIQQKINPSSEEKVAEIKPRLKVTTFMIPSILIHLIFFLFAYFQVKSSGIEGFKLENLYTMVFWLNNVFLLLMIFSNKYSFIIHNLITIQITNMLSGLLSIVGFILLLNQHWIEFIYPFIYPSFTLLIILLFLTILLECFLWFVEKFLLNLGQD